jgi:hypothetical protein
VLVRYLALSDPRSFPKVPKGVSRALVRYLTLRRSRRRAGRRTTLHALL